MSHMESGIYFPNHVADYFLNLVATFVFRFEFCNVAFSHRIQMLFLNLKLPFLLAAISVCGYWPSMRGTFTFDDKKAILQNEDVFNTSQSILSLFSHDFWGNSIVSPYSHKSYRPLTILSFRLNYYFSDFNELHYHVTNIVTYSIVITSFYYTIKTIFKNQHVTEDFYLRAVLLFIVHPVHVETVSSLVGRADLLSSLCGFLALTCYVKNYLFANALFVISAALCKETGIAILGVCFCADIVNGKFRNNQCRVVYLIALLIGIVAVRFTVMEFTVPKFQEGDNPVAFNPTLWIRVLNYFYIYMLNIIILLWPQWLCFDWSMGCIRLITDFKDCRIIAIIIFLFCILFTLCRLLRNQLNSILLMSLSLLVITFVPAMNIFFTVGFVIAERVLLVPSAGFCLLVTYGFEQLKPAHRRLKWAIWLIFCTILLLRTRQRIFDWQSEERLFKSGLTVCPQNAKVHYNVAKVLSDANNVTGSEYHYRTALKLYPNYDRAMNNLANLLKDQQRFRESEKLLKSAIGIDPNFAAAWMNLGTVLKSVGRFSDAENAYLTALRIRKGNYADCYYNLGNLYVARPQFENRAMEAWLNATQLNPKHLAAWNNILTLLDQKGEVDLAKRLAETALKWIPLEGQIHFHYATILAKLRQFEVAERHYLLALNLNPSNALYISNLAVLYHLWNKYDQAKHYYEKALSKKPHSKNVLENYKKLINAFRPKQIDDNLNQVNHLRDRSNSTG